MEGSPWNGPVTGRCCTRSIRISTWSTGRLKTGPIELKVSVVTDEEPLFNLPRWREPGTIEKVERFPKNTPWPAGLHVPLRARSKARRFRHFPSRHGDRSRAERFHRPGAANRHGSARNADETLHITGSADDIEYFDNGKVGSSGLDWFRIEFRAMSRGCSPPTLRCRIRWWSRRCSVYTADGKEYREGANANERVHQQTEGHRTEISRMLQPQGVYFLKVEANSPGYEVELRLRRPAPFTDPRQAVRTAMYDHISQVDAWLMNRPRGASVDRRIRDTGSLLGTHCMSCHTQSGVWGPAGAMLNGYRPENVANLPAPDERDV